MNDGPVDLNDSLRTLALGALALVVGSVVLFALIGLVSDDGSVVVAQSPTPRATETVSPSPDPTGAPTSESSDPDVTPTTDPTPTPSVSATGTVVSDDLEAAKGLTIQVLDAVLDDNGASQDRVVTCLRDAGFGSIIPNSASRVYAVTAVFYTPSDGSNRRAAQAIADRFGFVRVEEKPDNLSDTVAVHIVVGRDADDPC